MDNSFYHVSERTIERVAEVAAAAVPGCRTIDAKLAGLAGRSFPRINARLDQATGTVAVDTEIATSYPAPVAAITDAVRATIIAHIRTLVGLDVSRVKVTVANVETLPDTGRVTWDQVAEHEAFVIPTPIEVSPTRVEHPTTKPLQQLAPVKARSLVDDMRDMPNRAPLKQITVNRPPLKPIVVELAPRAPFSSAPAPRPVIVPKAPAPKPLKQITIEPVVKYYDRSR